MHTPPDKGGSICKNSAVLFTFYRFCDIIKQIDKLKFCEVFVVEDKNTNWGQSVTGVVIKEGKVLLARHTYGPGKGMLIIPGGYVNVGETPQDALVREYMEETKIKVKPIDIIGIRFNMHDWYIAFRAEYVSGEACSDDDENNEVLWMDIDEVMSRDDVPQLTKKLIQSATSKENGLIYKEYKGNTTYAPNSLYCV